MNDNTIQKFKPRRIINRIVKLDHMPIIICEVNACFSTTRQITIVVGNPTEPEIMITAILLDQAGLLFFDDCVTFEIRFNHITCCKAAA